MHKYDLKFDLKANVGHFDLYFIIQDISSKLKVVWLRASFTQVKPSLVCSSCRLKFLGSLICKQYGPRSDCSLVSSLIRVHIVCLHEKSSLKCTWIYAADLQSRHHFQTKSSGGIKIVVGFRVNPCLASLICKNITSFFRTQLKPDSGGPLQPSAILVYPF